MQIDMPKLYEKAIIHMEPNEVAILLDNIENYENQLTGQKKAFFLNQDTGSRNHNPITRHWNPCFEMCRS